jgi:diguanylate cyclase (GGDEF)-like protein
MGERLMRSSRRLDTVARYGGDEFAMLCTSLDDVEDLELIARRVIMTVFGSMRIGGDPLAITSSLGAVLTRDSLADPEALLQRADAAMYDAKRAGRGRFRIDTRA